LILGMCVKLNDELFIWKELSSRKPV